MCALANLTDEQHRAAVAALKDAHGHSLLHELLLYTAPPYPTSNPTPTPTPNPTPNPNPNPDPEPNPNPDPDPDP